MNNSTNAKRQTRVMVVTGALILTLAAVIIFLSVSQSRKKPTPEESTTPAVSDRVETHTADTDKPVLFEGTTPPETKGEEVSAPETTAASVPDEKLAPVGERLPDFISPVSGMLQKKHSVDVPVYSLTMEDYRTHSGVDIATGEGAAVRAAADGTVTEIWEDPMMGSCMKVEHSGGAVSVYKNLASTPAEGITVGSAVKAGTILASVGETALAEIAETTHLHYELQIDGVSVDPCAYMLIGGSDTGYEG